MNNENKFEGIPDLPEVLKETLESAEVVDVIDKSEKRTSRELKYDLGNRDLKPEQKIVIVLPSTLSGYLKDVYLGHMKKEQYWNLGAGENRKSYDSAGAYTRVRVLDGNDKKWKDWVDPKGYNPVKFAERRDGVEYENLHDWFGTVGLIKPLAIELTSSGKDPQWSVVTEVSLDVVTFPEMSEKVEIRERIYSPNTAFVDYKEGKQKLPIYGGGKHESAYPMAVPLGGKNNREHFEMTEKVANDDEYLDQSGRLHIKLPKGLKLLSLEVAIGDTWFNYKGPGKLQLGWAKFNACLRRADGSEDRFMNNVNIPPQGILTGGISDGNYVTREGDEIILESQNTSYLMGWRIMSEPEDSGDVADEIEDARRGIGDIALLGDGQGSEEIGFSDLDLDLDLEPLGKGEGTQGGQWHLDKKSGHKYFVKEYGGNFDRCATEYICNTVYRMMGVPAVKTHLVGNKAVSREVEGVLFPRNEKYDKSKVRDYFDHPDIKGGFVTDAWLCNWDVFGLNYDNIKKTPDGRMYRIDAGGCMFYRGMGIHKPSFAYEDENGLVPVTEIDSMRDPAMAREAGLIFKSVNEEEIREQVKSLAEKMNDDLIRAIVKASHISEPDKIADILIKRRKWLEKRYLMQ